MASPLVCIVIPSLNQARYLASAIDSVLAQDYPHVEVFVADGGSTDSTLEILRGYGDRIAFRSRPGGGQAAAINAGFARTDAEIVAWLDSDDRYCEGAITTAVAALERAPEAALVYGEGDLIDAAGGVLRRFPGTCPFNLWRLAHVADCILQPTGVPAACCGARRGPAR